MKLMAIKSLAAAALCAVGLSSFAAEPEAVQLWEGGPYWATDNLGTSEVQDHPDYGALYTFANAGTAVKSLLGEEWRVPSKAELQNLIKTSYCTRTWDSVRKGYTFTGATEGYTDKSIFLPAAGYDSWGNGRESAGNGGSGLYWSSEAYDGTYAWYLNFNEDSGVGVGNRNGFNRGYGMSVRAVR